MNHQATAPIELWNTQLEILNVIHQVCQKNNLRYSLAYGSLLGAVRHKGFIPWDDDLDLMMPRPDYEKLISIWHSCAPSCYILQNARYDTDFTQNFTKIRKNHTTFLQDEEERAKIYHKGIFVDIFPGDRVAPGKVRRMLQFSACAVSLLYHRGHTSGNGGVMGALEKFLLKIPVKGQIRLRNLAEKYIARWQNHADRPYLFANTIACARKYYPANLFDSLTTISFNGKEYCSVSDADATLRVEYGDYMQLPPVEERVWKHHPIIIDFEHNYEELTQK